MPARRDGSCQGDQEMVEGEEDDVGEGRPAPELRQAREEIASQVELLDHRPGTAARIPSRGFACRPARTTAPSSKGTMPRSMATRNAASGGLPAARPAPFLELIEDALHPAGVALIMCDRRLLSSDPHDWDEMVREAYGAEIYSRRSGERIADGYEARFRRYADPAGNAPTGFRRQPEPPHQPSPSGRSQPQEPSGDAGRAECGAHGWHPRTHLTCGIGRPMGSGQPLTVMPGLPRWTTERVGTFSLCDGS